VYPEGLLERQIVWGEGPWREANMLRAWEVVLEGKVYPCGTCQTAPSKVVPEPLPECQKRKKNMIRQPVSLNLHAVGRHFVENITGLEEIPVVDPEISEEEEQPLTDIRFRVSVR
jgi:hypothetical protein